MPLAQGKIRTCLGVLAGFWCLPSSDVRAADTVAGGHSIHISANFRSACFIRDAERLVILTGHTDAGRAIGPLGGSTGFRVECNVPYALSVRQSPAKPRGRLVPLSASGEDVHVPDPSADKAPEALRTTCELTAKDGRRQSCADTESAIGGAAPVIARAAARIELSRPDRHASDSEDVVRVMMTGRF